MNPLPKGYTRRPDGLYSKNLDFGDEITILIRSPAGTLLRVEHRPHPHPTPECLTTAEKIMRFICARYHITLAQLAGKSRKDKFVWPRWIAMSLIHQHTKFSLAQVGALFRRGHDTVMHALSALENAAQTSPRRNREITDISRAILFDLRPTNHGIHGPHGT